MKYVVIGASAAGINGAKTLRKLNPCADITLISKDTQIHSRCILHHYLKGKRGIQELNFAEDNFADKYKIQWLSGTEVTGVSPKEGKLNLSDGQSVLFDKLLIATGSHTHMPPIPNLDKAANVFGLRTLDDALLIKKQALTAKNIVVLGAGLVGIDAVEGLLSHIGNGRNISIVEAKGNILPMQLDERAAKAYQDAFAARGVKQYYNTSVENVGIDQQNKVYELILADGTRLACDFLVMATGVRANINFLQDSGIICDTHGLVFDKYGKTSAENIYGAGDVSGKSPIWPTAVKEGIIAASNMAGKTLELKDFFASKSAMNFLGTATVSLGDPNIKDPSCNVETLSDKKGNYKKIIHKNGVILGAIIQGDLSYCGVLTQIIKEEIDISRVKKPVFLIDYSDFFHLTKDLQFEYV